MGEFAFAGRVNSFPGKRAALAPGGFFGPGHQQMRTCGSDLSKDGMFAVGSAAFDGKGRQVQCELIGEDL